ncbi:MAG: hypothetical protein MJE68_10245 [Proteobacteria bacterium]|nr:hypothetical protein [Pseudomonadota bacterium]
MAAADPFSIAKNTGARNPMSTAVCLKTKLAKCDVTIILNSMIIIIMDCPYKVNAIAGFCL